MLGRNDAAPKNETAKKENSINQNLPKDNNNISDNEVFNWCYEQHSKGKTYASGARNAFIDSLAVFCCEYGVPESTCISGCLTELLQSDQDKKKDFEDVIKSAYNTHKAKFGNKKLAPSVKKKNKSQHAKTIPDKESNDKLRYQAVLKLAACHLLQVGKNHKDNEAAIKVVRQIITQLNQWDIDENIEKAIEAASKMTPAELKTYEKDKINNLQFSKLIKQEIDLVKSEGLFYQYNGTTWDQLKSEKLTKQIIKIFTQYYFEDYERSFENDVLHILGANYNVPYMNPYKNLIALSNGYFDVERQIFCKYSEKTRKKYFTTPIDIEYNPGAKCKRFTSFIDEILAGNQYAEDERKLLQEWAGYCLTFDTKYQKALFLLGDGGNGKSVYIEILQALVGKQYNASVSMENISEPYYLYTLIGKKLNAVAETKKSTHLDSEAFKAQVSGDKMQARLIRKEVVEFTPTHKMLFAMNDRPFVKDTSEGFFRRLLMVRLNNSFHNSNTKDVNLSKFIIEKELPGVLNWAINGLVRLTKKGSFTIPASSITEITFYKESSNPVIEFIKDCCIVDNECWQPIKELYKLYGEFCKEIGNYPLNQANFRNELKRQLKTKIDLNVDGFGHVKKIDGKPARIVKGIKHVDYIACFEPEKSF